MDYQSIIRTIASSLASNGKGHLRIVERDLMGELTAGDKYTRAPMRNTFDLRKHRPRFKEYQARFFPVTSWLMSLANWILFWIWFGLVYIIPARICSLFTTRDWRREVNNMVRNFRYNFFIICAAVIAYVSIFITSINFFLSDVLLFSRPPYSNLNGTLVIEQPFQRVHHIFLFNTAIFWSNTGIEVAPDDEIYVTASGAFFNDIHAQKRSALENFCNPSLSLIQPAFQTEDKYNASDAISSARVLPTAPYGAILYSVSPDVFSGSTAHQIRELKLDPDSTLCIRPTEHGVLRFCINDIYFTDAVIDKLLKDPSASEKIYHKFNASVFGKTEIISKADSMQCDSIIRNILKENRDLWFRDNSGEILLNIIVDRNINSRNDISASHRLLSSLLTPLNRAINPAVNDGSSKLLKPGLFTLVVIVVLLIADNVIGRLRRRKKQLTS